jgi:hypothetical protein
VPARGQSSANTNVGGQVPACMMPDNGNVAIPYDYWHIKLKTSEMQAQ